MRLVLTLLLLAAGCGSHSSGGVDLATAHHALPSDGGAPDDLTAAPDGDLPDQSPSDGAPVDQATPPDMSNLCLTVKCSQGFTCCPCTGMCYDNRCLACCMFCP